MPPVLPLSLADLEAWMPHPGRADYAVLGHPIGHSLSPKMQGAAFADAGIDAAYRAIEVPPEELERALRLLREKNFAGWNATVPLKTALYDFLEREGELAPSAREAGAVNTVRRERDRLVGHSTDGLGWERAVEEDFNLKLAGLDLLILGAGGSGATLARRAAAGGCGTLRVANRSREKLAALEKAVRTLSPATLFEAIPWEAPALAEAVAVSSLVVNATTLGLGDTGAPPIPIFPPQAAYYDIVYGAEPTPFLRAAAAAGARTAGGRSMLLHQGALAWEIWTGKPAPLDAMRRALHSSS